MLYTYVGRQRAVKYSSSPFSTIANQESLPFASPRNYADVYPSLDLGRISPRKERRLPFSLSAPGSHTPYACGYIVHTRNKS